MYYALTNFYQNHRRYVKSRDDSQLWGKADKDIKPSSDCGPFDISSKFICFYKVGYRHDILFKLYEIDLRWSFIFLLFVSEENGKYIYPCGAIANSMFSDEIDLYYHPPQEKEKKISLIRTGIAWDSDKKFKFQNPPNINADAEMWKYFTKPRGKGLNVRGRP
jgi:hypothetical protein